MIAQRARDDLAAVAFCALVGGQDELVFDGHSVVVDHEGTVIARAPQFEEALLIADVDPVAAGSARLRDTRRRAPAARGARRTSTGSARSPSRDRPSDAPLGEPRSRRCSTTSRRSTARSCSARATTRARTASSTSCSASAAASTRRSSRSIAVDALGADRVTCVTMPSPYSSTGHARRRRSGSPRTSASSCSSCRSSR